MHGFFIEDTDDKKEFSKTGCAYLINVKGLVLIHPREDYILKHRLFDQPGAEALARMVKSQKTGTAYFLSEGSRRIAGAARIGLTGWTVVFSQSREEITAPVNRILTSIFLAGIIFLVITISTIIIYFHRISTPIQNMMEMIEQVTWHSTEVIMQIGLNKKIS